MNDDCTKIFNVFISYTYDGIQDTIVDELYEIFNNDKEIGLIDVSKESCGMASSLTENILRQINTCDMMICLLTPITNSDSIPMLNYNLVLELGYAYGCLEPDKIHILIKEDEETKSIYEKIRPSMLSQFKYDTYINYEDIKDLILADKKKYDDANEIIAKRHNYLGLQDTGVVSMIKFQILEILNKDVQYSEKITKLEHYLDNYIHVEIYDIIFSFGSEYIETNQPMCYDPNVILWFFDFLRDKCMSIITSWFCNLKNQKNVLTLFDMIKYKLFCKLHVLDNKEINKARCKFVITIMDLLNANINVPPVFAYKDELKDILEESFEKLNDPDYQHYVLLMEKLYAYRRNGNTDMRYLYEDLIMDFGDKYNIFI